MTYDFIIVGAGIVGMATAYKLSLQFPDKKIVVLEKENEPAKHQTGNNSGVIHSGIYYKPGSYKVRNCVEGRRQLIDFCEVNKVNYNICGKVIVATEEEELERLEKLYQRGLENKIPDIELIDQDRLKEIEPYVSGLKAIRVPSAGIVDFKQVCLKLKEILEKRLCEFGFNKKVEKIIDNGNLIVKTNGGDYEGKYLINCAGLHSDKVAESAGLDPKVKIIPFRGEYYKLKPSAHNLVNWLIYPLPNPVFPFLGVHFTRMIDGAVECGPNAVLAYKREGYTKFSFDIKDFTETITYSGLWKVIGKFWTMGLGEMYRSFSKKAFHKALTRLLPSLKIDDLKPGGAGVRANAVDVLGHVLDDFHFVKAEKQVHVLNAPSPAATASLAIADEIVSMAVQHFEL